MRGRVIEPHYCAYCVATTWHIHLIGDDVWMCRQCGKEKHANKGEDTRAASRTEHGTQADDGRAADT